MEKLTVSNAFQKAVDSLKNTECSQKEKKTHFIQIVECILSPSLRSNTNFLTYLSASISTLLMFCEDSDFVTRSNAEENLNNIIRFCENGYIVRVQIELYHEIKRNGNEKSLRICLNLFSHYCHLIKQRKARSYAQNLLPCIFVISKRKETILIESLCEFMKLFCKYLQNCMNDNEIVKLIEIFLGDIKLECTVKRRCASQNVITLIENSRKVEQFAQYALNFSLDLLINDQNQSTILGVMGFLRLLLPIILRVQNCDIFKAIEILELCLQYLNETNHSIINASLEVINVILSNASQDIKLILCSSDSKEILLKRKSLKNIVFNITLSESRIVSRKSSVETMKAEVKKHLKLEEPSQNSSDVELESLKSVDFEAEIQLSQNLNKTKDIKSENVSLKSQKSTESIGSFINSLLTHSNTESVSKFFRSQKSTESPKVRPPATSNAFDDDNVSFDSMNNSFVSMQSLPDSRHDSLITLKEDLFTFCDEKSKEIEPIEFNTTDSTFDNKNLQSKLSEERRRDIFIGTIFDQTILEYVVRLICSKFLLEGKKFKLISDLSVRVSIKSLSLLVLSNCVSIHPEVLLLTLELPTSNVSEYDQYEFLIDEQTNVETIDKNEERNIDKEKNETLDDEENKIENDFLEIKDDHFGENPNNYFNFYVPLTKSTEDLLKFDLEPNSKLPDFESTSTKLNKDLNRLLSKSDLNENSSNNNFFMRMNSSHSDINISQIDGQQIYDILLFYNHLDPVLRGYIQLIIGNFIRGVLIKSNEIHYNDYLNNLTTNVDTKLFLNLNRLLTVLIEGFFDEIHMVVKQALISFDNIFEYLLYTILPSNNNNYLNNNTNSTENLFQFKTINKNNIFLNDNLIINKNISIEYLLDNLLLICSNKYWVIQCKYCDVIAVLDYTAINNYLGIHRGEMYHTKFLDQLFLLLKDNDVRVRNHVGLQFCVYIEKQEERIKQNKNNIETNKLIETFIDKRIFKELPSPLCHINTAVKYSMTNHKDLGRVLYNLSNKLLEIDDKNQQFGVVNAIKELISKYNPIFYNQLWNEFKYLDMCIKYTEQNVIMGLDLTCQNNLIEICTHLLAGTSITNTKQNIYVNDFLTHLLKLLNIFDHMFTNTKPLVIPKSQKVDLFVGGKELQLLNKIGYFGNSHFYIRLYQILKSSYESYKITINKESGLKMFKLLKTLLHSLSVILELKTIDNLPISIKLIEEILSYLMNIIVFAPKQAVACTKTLLKYLFGRNFITRREHYNFFLNKKYSCNSDNNDELLELFEYIKEFYTYKPSDLSETSDSNVEHGSYIKLFEPMVIYCLKLFTKSNSIVQTEILDMLCQLLEFKVNYCLLDANNVFIDFILKHLDLIESGIVRKCEILIPSIMRFLFYLSKQKDKKLITIPKIINITDNLLANNMIRNGSINSLVELAYEIFFIQKIIQTFDNTSELQLKELSTQKEVISSMLVKFLDYVEIQEISSVVIILNKQNGETNENEILQIILQMLQDNKINIKYKNQLISLDSITKISNKNILFENKNFENLLCLLFTAMDSDHITLHELGITFIILENIIFNTEEVYIFNHIKLLLASSNNKITCEPSLTSSTTIASSSSIKTFTILTDPIQFFVKKLLNFLNNCIKRIFLNSYNSIFLEYYKNLIELLKKIQKFSTICECLCIALKKEKIFIEKNLKMTKNYLMCSMIFIEFLIEIDYDELDLLKLLQKNNNISDIEYLKINLINLLIIKKQQNIKSETIIYLMENDIEILFNNFKDYLLKLINDDKHSLLIFSKLKDFYLYDKTDLKGNKLLNLFEKSSNLISNHVIKLINDEFLYHNRKILSKKGIILCMRLLIDIENSKNIQSNESNDYIYHEINFKRLLENIFLLKINETFPQLYSRWSKLNHANVQNEYKKKIKVLNLDKIKTIKLDENWFLQQVKYNCTSTKLKKQYIVQLLNEIKSESKVIDLIETNNFNVYIISDCIEYSLKQMIINFKINSIQFTPHINYLKITPLLKVSIITLTNNLKKMLLLFNEEKQNNTTKIELLTSSDFEIQFTTLRNAVISLLKNINSLEKNCLIFIDTKLIDKFINENLLKTILYEFLLKFVTICFTLIDYQLKHFQSIDLNDLNNNLICIDLILKYKYIWNKLNNNDTENNTNIYVMAVNCIYLYLKNILSTTNFWKKYKNPELFKNYQNENQYLLTYLRTILIAKYLEEQDNITIKSCYILIKEAISSVATSILRTNFLYSFSITPYELYSNYNGKLKDFKMNHIVLPSIPIDYLNDVEILKKFVKRINTFGFTSRQQFEEFFMSLLVLVNKESDLEMIDVQEQFYIKSICLYTITELLVSCKMYPRIGYNSQGNFYHSPRLNKIKVDTISLRKLHNIQLFIPNSNIFYQSNLEWKLWLDRDESDNVIGTYKFHQNQFGMNYIWQIVEENSVITDITIKNSRYIIDQFGIDIRSSLQLIYDVFSQLIEVNYVLILPHLVKICEICEKREQFKWIKDTMILLQEKVPMENTISHQYIIYLLCKSYAVLVPSLNDLTQLCTLIPTYLKSTHLFIRNATLSGLLCLLESCVNTNTTIGSLNEELLLIRNVVINYIIKHGIIEDSSVAYSDVHTKLVWTLNFYLIEKTSKFVLDCNLLSNTIISANNLLKNTTNLEQYLCILHGLERIIASNTALKLHREKIEKLALDLVKLENEEFSIPALKLLITCMYVGSSEQIENTEHSNGIVQDEPEVILQSIEKIDVLFMRIKTAKPESAEIFGNTLCQIVKDLVPPNEILTKVIKELLTLSQPHCEVVARIVFQVFRSAIDSSYHSLLQDWLICSLPNFVSLPINKAIWCLTIIFVSASININVVRIFPEILGKYGSLEEREIINFILTSKDFYEILTAEQKVKFREVFIECDSIIYKDLLNCLL